MDLSFYINAVDEEIDKLITETGEFYAVNNGVWSYKTNDSNFTIYIYPDRILYFNTADGEKACLSWKIKIEYSNTIEDAFAVNFVEDILSIIKYGAIKDEDMHGKKDKYRIETFYISDFYDTQFKRLECWICPDFRDGYWQNHILP